VSGPPPSSAAELLRVQTLDDSSFSKPLLQLVANESIPYYDSESCTEEDEGDEVTERSGARRSRRQHTRSSSISFPPPSREMSMMAGTLRTVRSSLSPPRQYCADAVDQMLAGTENVF
jgi:hypothetical protein